jgi:hypothetical protein
MLQNVIVIEKYRRILFTAQGITARWLHAEPDNTSGRKYWDT